MNNLFLCPNEVHHDWMSRSTNSAWISENTIRLTLPYLDAANDYIEVYVQKKRNGYLLSDDGETLSLIQDRIRDSAKAKEILQSSGVSLNNENEITMECREKNLPKRSTCLRCAS